MGGLYFLRPRTLIARVEPDATETPLLTLERAEDGILTIAMQFLNQDGDLFGHVRPGCAPVPSKLLTHSSNKEKWRITSRDTGALVCGIERTWGLDWATLEVSFNMWIHGRPVKITPRDSNVPEIIPCAPHADPLPECGLRFHKGVKKAMKRQGITRPTVVWRNAKLVLPEGLDTTNISETAKQFGVSRATLIAAMLRQGIRRPDPARR